MVGIILPLEFCFILVHCIDAFYKIDGPTVILNLIQTFEFAKPIRGEMQVIFYCFWYSTYGILE